MISKNLLYLFFHAISFILVLASVLGTPGTIDPESVTSKMLMKLMDFLLPLAWYGIPVLFILSLIAFFIGYVWMGRLCCIVSLALGAGLFLTMVIFYAVK
ncbi:MAG: hypothetical protein OJF59_003070 [Cytophagales bacterium]|jgi:hypothetical protein|nr:hypothetical protein [Bacteroidota bacterium]MBS1981295.1 hypothetical protein [Bacteroidota bacterium]WHZ09314.1 MAG: hypothetical protein OJF59_003070 [Cytophagales bacterium]